MNFSGKLTYNTNASFESKYAILFSSLLLVIPGNFPNPTFSNSLSIELSLCLHNYDSDSYLQYNSDNGLLFFLITSWYTEGNDKMKTISPHSALYRHTNSTYHYNQASGSTTRQFTYFNILNIKEGWKIFMKKILIFLLIFSQCAYITYITYITYIIFQ